MIDDTAVRVDAVKDEDSVEESHYGYTMVQPGVDRNRGTPGIKPKSRSKQNNASTNMAPLTRSAKRKIPPDETKAGEADIIKRIQGFNAYDDHHAHQSLWSIVANSRTTVPSADRWL